MQIPNTRNIILAIITMVLGATVVLIFDNYGLLDAEKNNHVKTTESRYVKEFSLETGTLPNGILVDNTGKVWVAGSKTYSLYKFDPKINQIQTYKIQEPNEAMQDRPLMVWTMLEKNNTIWFSQLGTKSILLFDTISKKFDKIDGVSSAPFQMKTDENGNVWFTTISHNTVGVVQKTSNANIPYKISEFYTGNDTQPAGIYLDGNYVWVTELLPQKIVKFKITKENNNITKIDKVLELPHQNSTRFSYPTDVFALENSLWFTEHETNFIANYDIQTGTLNRFPTSQSEYGVSTLPYWMRPIDNGTKVWFNEHEGNKIALFDATAKTLTEYEIPSRPNDGYVVYPLTIAVDPNNNNKLWFTEYNTDKFGVVDAGIDLPFSIQANTSKVFLKNDSSDRVIDIKLSKNKTSEPIKLSLNASSSLDQAGGLYKIDSYYTKKIVQIDNESEHVQMHLRNLDTPAGNFTLGISATDGTVTKTIFVNLVV